MKLKIGFKKIDITEAHDFKTRLIGLMNKKNINEGILFLNCHAVHTFFMKENIDIVLLDSNYKVLDIRKNIKKNKIIIFKKKNIKKTHILELPQNMSKKLNINEILKIEN